MADAYTVSALSPLRKVIAARMTESKRTIPHFRLMAELDMGALIDLRRRLRVTGDTAHPSLNDLLIKACASALMEIPAVNVQFVDGAIHQYRCADISVVTAIEGGLATPIVRNAESKSIPQISAEVKELAARAARNALKLNEIAGGTFSISNLGMYGVDQFDAIINPPQCAILAVGRTRARLLISRGGQSRVATVANVTLSVDHRAIDGAVGAQFLSALRRFVEHPDV